MKRKLINLTIGMRLAILVCLSVLSVLATVAVGMSNSRTIAAIIEQKYQSITRPLAAVAEARGEFNAMRTALYDLAQDFNSGDQNDGYKERILRILTEYEQHILLYKGILDTYGTCDPYEREAVEYLSGQLVPLRVYIEHITAIAEKTGRGADAVRLLRGDFLDSADDISQELMTLTGLLETQAHETNQYVNEVQRRNSVISLVIMAFSAICLLLLAYVIVGSIRRPMRELTSAAKRMARGELNIAIVYDARNELGILADGFRIMTKGLQTYLRDKLQAEHELAEGRISIMLSQIQPHFLYNVLASIRRLCTVDANEARDALAELSKYLRVNMDSLTLAVPIPFRKELEHVDIYLSLEKRRFGERLQIVLDIQTHNFALPALTLQPIVENAVRYGVTKKDEGGTVTIMAKETDAAFVITVSDDGGGFDPNVKKDDGESHVGIENVRNRLAAMCGGTLTVRSEIGTGTTVVIKIPKGDEAK